MNRERACDGEFLEDFGEDFLPLLISENRMVLIVKAENISAFVMIPHETFEGDEGTRSGIGKVFTKLGEVE